MQKQRGESADNSQTVELRMGRGRLTVRVPASADVLRAPPIPALADPAATLRSALRHPRGTDALRAVAERIQPESVVITMSDITRPVPNELIITAILEELALAGVPAAICTILIATGMHRPSTPEEREFMLGRDLLARCRVVDHRAEDASNLVRVSDDPPVSLNRIYAEADLKIVTGLIEPHFMAGYSGGRKGICPGLVDLETVQRFHGFRTMGDPAAVEGKLDGNPCHEIALRVATQIGCDFLVNAAITDDRAPAGFFAGDLVEAHRIGCDQVGAWTTVPVGTPYDAVLTSAGGYPLDQNFYQTVKGMVTALPALADGASLLICSACQEVGSPEYTALMAQHGSDYREFLRSIATEDKTAKDQWQYQLHTRVLERIGVERLLLANDGLPIETQAGLAVTPLPGSAPAADRVQAWVDQFLLDHPEARIAVIPEGPYTLLKG